MSAHEKLSAAANDRKARLAQLKSLKRKQASDGDIYSAEENMSSALNRTEETEPSVTSTYLSGRNFDPATRNVKLGFDNTPIVDPTKTLEYQAQKLALESKQQQVEERKADKPLDLFQLQPKKPNWDLKRDLNNKMKVLNVQTENAIAKLVRERVEAQKKEQATRNTNAGEEVGMDGAEFVEAMHLKEREEEQERERDARNEEAI